MQAVKLFVLVYLLPMLFAQTSNNYNGFIKVSNGRFVDANCKEYFFSGWNAWRLIDAATNRFNPAGHADGKSYIRNLFQKANAAQLNVLRFFTTGDDDMAVVLMESPGQFNEYALQGLDFILDEAAKAGIKLVMVPLNLWKKNNGVPQFEEWCGSSLYNTKPRPDIDLRPGTLLNVTERLQTPYDWYMNPFCRDMYKDYLSGLVHRQNSINGIVYRDDPVIFSWNIINEPRCKYCGPQPVTDWIHDMASYLKSIDPNHMVTTGEEGFFDEASPLSIFNPDDANRWGVRTGQDFVANHDSPNIDYAVMHLWPDNWQNPPLGIEFGKNWIDSHKLAAKQLGKPLVLEEFGKNSDEDNITAVRDPWFEMVYTMVRESLDRDGVLRGALFWQWDGYGSGPRKDSGSNIRETDSTFQELIAPFSQQTALRALEVHRSSGTALKGCK